MTKLAAVAVKRQMSNNEATDHSLVIEEEAAEILQRLSNKNTGCHTKNNRVVSPVFDCGESQFGNHKKRKLCDSGNKHNQSPAGSFAPNAKKPVLLSPDNDSSSSLTRTDLTEGSSESCSTSCSENEGPFSLRKVAIKPLTQPPPMRRFNNFSNPGGPPIFTTRVPSQHAPKKSTEKIYGYSELQKDAVFSYNSFPSRVATQPPKLQSLHKVSISNNFAVDSRFS